MPKKIFLFIALSTSGIIFTSETTHKELPHKAYAHIVHTPRYGVNLGAHIYLYSPKFSMHMIKTARPQHNATKKNETTTKITYKQNNKEISPENIQEHARKELIALYDLLMAKVTREKCFENRYNTWFIGANNEIIPGNETLINN